MYRCFAGLAFCPMKPEEVETRCVLGSIARSHKLGEAVLKARKASSSPIDAILQCEAGTLLATGKARCLKFKQTESSWQSNLTFN